MYTNYCALYLLLGGTCANNTCLNGGSCVEVFGMEVECRCLSDFFGTRCETGTFQRRIMGFHKSTLVARGADTQLDPSGVSAPLATMWSYLHVLRNMDIA